MIFPDDIDNPNLSDEQRASNRLKYIISRTALEATGDGSVAKFASVVGMDPSTIFIYIKRGRFSSRAAITVEDAFGREVLPNEWLRRPLEVGIVE